MYLLLSDVFLDECDNEEESSNRDDEETKLKAITNLKTSVEIFEKLYTKTKKTSTACKIGEICVNPGNLYDIPDVEDSDSLGWYTKAVEFFKAADALDPGCVPEQFLEFLNEWEKDILDIV
jgi:hypothetical protein